MVQRENLEDQIAALEATLGTTAGGIAAFDGELGRLRESLTFTGAEVDRLASGLGRGVRRAFDGMVFDGMKASDALRGLAQSMVDTVYNVAMRPVQSAVGGALAQGLNGVMGSILPMTKGGGFTEARVQPFAKGGVVAMAAPVALRGPAPGALTEALAPVARAAGDTSSAAGRPLTVVMNIQTPDVQGFQRSQAQIAAQASRALARGQRNR